MQSLQARRRNREENGELTSRQSAESLPDLEYTLVEYAWPLIRRLHRDHGPEELEDVLRFASLVWNAVIEKHGDPAQALLSLAGAVRREGGAPSVVVVVGALAYRKAEHYACDHRRVARVDVRRNGKKLRVTVSAGGPQCQSGMASADG